MTITDRCNSYSPKRPTLVFLNGMTSYIACDRIFTVLNGDVYVVDQSLPDVILIHVISPDVYDSKAAILHMRPVRTLQLLDYGKVTSIESSGQCLYARIIRDNSLYGTRCTYR